MNLKYLKYFLTIIIVVALQNLFAVSPVNVAPEHEERYHDLLSELRCLVCQNQTIEESDSELAHDLRKEVNNMLNQGASDSEIIEFMANRYGDFVLYRPLVQPKTYLLWFGTFVFLALVLILVLIIVKRHKPTNEGHLSEEEQQKLKSLLKDTKE